MIKIYRIIALLLYLTASHRCTVCQGSHTPIFRNHIDLVRSIFSKGIKPSRCDHLCLICSINICRHDLFLIIAQASHPAASIRLINAVVIICIFHSGVCYTLCTHMGIIIGNIKNSIFSKILSPAVLADKGTISRHTNRKVGSFIVIIPSNDHHIMIGFLCSPVTVGICPAVIVRRFIQIGVAYVGINGCGNTTILIDSPFNGIQIVLLKELHFLHMLADFHLIISGAVPGKQIGSCHGIVPSRGNRHGKCILFCHMVHRKVITFQRQQRRLQRSQGCICPAGRCRALIPDS